MLVHLGFSRIRADTISCNHMAKEEHLSLKQVALPGFQTKACTSQSRQHFAKVLQMVRERLRCYENIIQIHKATTPLQSSQDPLYDTLESCKCIA